MPEVDRVLGNEEKLQAASYRNSDTAVSDIMQKTVASPLRKRRKARARAFVQVQTVRPSLHFCTIPLWPRQFALRAGRRCGRALSRFAGGRT